MATARRNAHRHVAPREKRRFSIVLALEVGRPWVSLDTGPEQARHDYIDLVEVQRRHERAVLCQQPVTVLRKEIWTTK